MILCDFIILAMRVQENRDQGDLFGQYEVDHHEGFRLSNEGKRIMLMITIFLAILTAVLILKVKFGYSFEANGNDSDF